jgi:hypothetical protein
MRLLGHTCLVLFLTAVTQVGGVAWLLALRFRHRLVSFVALYAVLSLAAGFVAPMFGRVALSCTGSGPLQVQSWFYCLTNRTYVTPELRDVAIDLAAQMAAEFPGTTTLILDGNLPFFDGFPLLPHLSHDDGEKLDLALYYQSAGVYLPGRTRSPLGYFAFEQGPTDCPADWLTLRWDLDWLQGVFPAYTPDRPRMQAALAWLVADARIGKVFLEPHLTQSLGVSAPKLRFQGCRAARHDDHIHIQL